MAAPTPPSAPARHPATAICSRRPGWLYRAWRRDKGWGRRNRIGRQRGCFGCLQNHPSPPGNGLHPGKANRLRRHSGRSDNCTGRSGSPILKLQSASTKSTLCFFPPASTMASRYQPGLTIISPMVDVGLAASDCPRWHEHVNLGVKGWPLRADFKVVRRRNRPKEQLPAAEEMDAEPLAGGRC